MLLPSYSRLDALLDALLDAAKSAESSWKAHGSKRLSTHGGNPLDLEDPQSCVDLFSPSEITYVGKTLVRQTVKRKPGH